MRRFISLALLVLSLFLPLIPPSASAAAPPTVVDIVAHGSWVYARKSDGSVWVWGGWLLPTPIPNLPPIKALAAGNETVYFLTQDGTVLASGSNSAGEFGNGTQTSKREPAPVPGMTGVKAIGAGDYTGYAIKEDGTLWAWGQNMTGLTGLLWNVQRSLVPVKVAGISDAVAVTAHLTEALVLKADGTLWVLGPVSLPGYPARLEHIPVQIQGIADVVELAFPNVVRKADGTVWTWGDAPLEGVEDERMTGQCYRACAPAPVQLSNLADVRSLGRFVAAKADGTVWGWGHGGAGLLGVEPGSLPRCVTGTSSAPCAPVARQIPGLAGVVAVESGSKATYAIKSDGTVWALGSNDTGQLGDPSLRPQLGVYRANPGPVIGLYTRDFTDLGEFDWAVPAIELLAAPGIMNGVAPDQFDPAGVLTREQFAALLQRSFGLKGSGTAPASDVDPSRWSYGAIQAAAPYLAEPAVPFEPEARVDRQTVAAAMVRLLIARGALPPVEPRTGDSTISALVDSGAIRPELRPLVAAAVQHKVMLGMPDGRFDPAGPLTRAQAAVLLNRIRTNFSH